MLNGQYDKFHNQTELVGRLRRLLPRVHFEVVPNAGWPIEIERPAYINAAINNYLNYAAATYRTTFPAFYINPTYPSATVAPAVPTPLAQEVNRDCLLHSPA